LATTNEGGFAFFIECQRQLRFWC